MNLNLFDRTDLRKKYGVEFDEKAKKKFRIYIQIL